MKKVELNQDEIEILLSALTQLEDSRSPKRNEIIVLKEKLEEEQ